MIEDQKLKREILVVNAWCLDCKDGQAEKVFECTSSHCNHFSERGYKLPRVV